MADNTQQGGKVPFFDRSRKPKKLNQPGEQRPAGQTKPQNQNKTRGRKPAALAGSAVQNQTPRPRPKKLYESDTEGAAVLQSALRPVSSAQPAQLRPQAPQRPPQSQRPQGQSQNQKKGRQSVASAATAAAQSGAESRKAGPAHAAPGILRDNVPVHIIPLGGLREVGKNTTLVECQGDMLMVDCGSIFPEDDLLGVDLVIPDFTFAKQNAARIKGLFVTHGHEDHIGALPYFLKEVRVPVYGTPLTLGLLANKLEEHGLARSVEMHEIQPGDHINCGRFTVTPIHVNHSIPDAVALAVDTAGGTILFTGDFKIDYTPIACGVTDLAAFTEYGNKGVLALLSDSTNSERPGYSRSERSVGAAFMSLFSKAEGKRIIIATFASNIYRVQQIFDMAAKVDRKVVITGRSMVNNVSMALRMGYLKAPGDLVIDMDEVRRWPPEKLVIVTTGSQGEELAALSRMAAGMHRDVSVGSHDFIILSATPIPGNERSVTKVINGLLMQGAEVIYESIYDVHVSGHAYQDEQKLLLSLVKPKYFFPVHGEYKHQRKHADTARSLGMEEAQIIMAKNGDIWRLTPEAAALESEVPAGRVLVDGLGVGDVGNVVLRDRQHLSQDGLVIVVASIDEETGELLSGPDIISRGFVYVKESEQLLQESRKMALSLLERSRQDWNRDFGGVKLQLREGMAQFFYERTKRSPMVLPILMEV